MSPWKEKQFTVVCTYPDVLSNEGDGDGKGKKPGSLLLSAQGLPGEMGP